MELYTKIIDLKEAISKKRHTSIGFVPTMGALHKGHISLIKSALSENDLVICSVFVNPTQFNNAHDLKVYPRNIELDKQVLEEAGCHFLFAPSIEEVYPTADSSKNSANDYGLLTKVMEATHRPGHFDGVIMVVKRLFEIVEPTNAYFGEKDYQQLAVVRKLVEKCELKTIIVGCPIIREEDGLAMSSRNVNLNTEERSAASLIPKILMEAKNQFKNKSILELKNWVYENFNNNKFLKLEYFELANADSLETLSDDSNLANVRGFIAVYCGKTRLIDNLKFS